MSAIAVPGRSQSARRSACAGKSSAPEAGGPERPPGLDRDGNAGFDLGERPRLLDPTLREAVGDRKRVDRPADDYQLAVEVADQPDHALQQRLLEAALHEHQGHGERRPRQ
jgi:hypothetical protein